MAHQSSTADDAPARTADYVRKLAKAHFDRFAAFPGFGDWDANDCQQYAHYGKLLVDIALALPVGAELPLADFWSQHALSGKYKAMTLRILNVCQGHLDLLRMECYHQTAGVIPPDVVLAMEDTPAPYPYKGIELTRATLLLRFVRLPL